MFRLIASILFLLCFANAKAQRFGGFKPSKQWNQLKNENYSLLYSTELEKTAKKVAAILSRMNAIDVNIGDKRRNISIILQNSTTQANGYVGLAPFVSEFFLTPYPDHNAIGTLPWHYTLAIHEYQHVLQYSNSYYGVSKIAHKIGGEFLWGGFQAVAIPNWFFEGNAVQAETQYTRQGRGRIPSFFNGYRSFTLEHKIPSYDKARNGSIQDFVPSHYPLGYLMVKYGREKYGAEYWTNVLRNSSSYKGIIYPFSRALKKEGGEHSRKMYAGMIDEFSKEWNQRDHEVGELMYVPKKEEVLNFSFPTIDQDGSLFFIQSSYDKASAFYSVKNGTKEKLRMAGIRSNNYFDVYEGKILSTQTYVDKRWGWIDYEDIIIYDSNSKNFRKLTTEGKYFHPAFSVGGEEIIAQYAHPNGTYEVHILETSTGNLIKKVHNPKNLYISNLQHFNSNEYIGTARDKKGQMAIVKVLANGTIAAVSPWTYHIIGRATSHNGVLYFQSSFDGADNLYSINNNTITQLSQHGSGRYSPIVNAKNGNLYFTQFSTNGMLLKKVALNELSPVRVLKEFPSLTSLDFYNSEFILNSEKIEVTESLDSSEISEYANSKDLINIHSWVPDISRTDIGIDITSENVLNTLDVSAGYSYNLNENQGGVNIRAIYSQYYLHFNAFAANRQRSISVRSGTVSFNEFRTGLGLSLPLNFSTNTFQRNLRLSSGYNFISTNSSEIATQDFHIVNSTFNYSQIKLKARKNIFSKLGFNSTISDQRAFNAKNYQFLAKNTISLPALFKNDNFVVEADAQFTGSSTNYRYTNRFEYSRGFNGIRADKLYKLSANYHFPIAYPDKGTLGVIYFLRIRGNFFYDHTSASSESINLSSVGAELIFDTRLLRLLSASIGLRYTSLLSEKSFSRNEGKAGVFEVFIPVTRF